ncbi:MAG TPA: hypothetical protein PKA63_13665 [Oligoflexia bacterium]|nr:hypothetical protein [Oligoflexia bacterium]HMP49710.1 hypothetical protein [Oligoflexia bacterium]
MNESTSSQGILRTVKAFESQIEGLARAESDESLNPLGEAFETFKAIAFLRISLRKVLKETSFKRVVLSLVEDDAYGWPRLKLIAGSGDSIINELVVSAQDRRNGPVIVFNESSASLSIELEESDFKNPELCDRTLRSMLRSFFESVKLKISESNSIQQKVASVLQMLPEESVSGYAKEMNLDIEDKVDDVAADICEEKKVAKTVEPDDPSLVDDDLENMDFFN